MIFARFILLGLLAPFPLLGQNKYEDQPMGLTTKGVEIIDAYSQQARKSLPHFDQELQAPGNRQFFVITKLHEGKIFEQIYVRVSELKAGSYAGRIASEPMGPVKFKHDSPIEVAVPDVVDWCILLPSGEEEGNLTGKAMDALQVGIISCIIEMKPENGVFRHFTVLEARNPKTQQKIAELVPAQVIEQVETEAQRRFGKLKSKGAKPAYQFVLVRFPTWEILPP